jgi:hypothetical protein
MSTHRRDRSSCRASGVGGTLAAPARPQLGVNHAVRKQIRLLSCYRQKEEADSLECFFKAARRFARTLLLRLFPDGSLSY